MNGTAGVSAIMAVYEGVPAAHLVEALESLCAQTAPAEEVILVRDGPLTPALEAVIDEFRNRLPLLVLALEHRSGSAHARNAGLRRASQPWVAIADADDISMADRFAVQLAHAQAQGLDLVGAAMEEFEEATPRLGVRRFPAGHDEVVARMASRNPINHPSVMMRRSLVLQVDGYRNLPLLEDYDLCVRLVGAGAKVGNIDSCLVRFRGGRASLRRRRDLIAVKSEWAMQRSLHRAGLVAAWRMPVNWLARNAFRSLPPALGRRAYRSLFLD